MYILEQLSSWSTSRIRRHGLVLRLYWTSGQLSSPCIFLVCPGPTSILLFVPTIHVSHMHPPLPTGQLNTCAQVNYMAMLHHMYMVTHIYITFILLSIPPSYFFHSFGQAGWLRPFLSVTVCIFFQLNHCTEIVLRVPCLHHCRHGWTLIVFTPWSIPCRWNFKRAWPANREACMWHILVTVHQGGTKGGGRQVLSQGQGLLTQGLVHHLEESSLISSRVSPFH